jgi:integrase/recombinase XerD
MQLYDSQGKRLYLTADERRAFIAAAATADRPVRTLCTVLHDTGCRISEALALTSENIDLSGRAVMFESLKKRRRGIYRAVPVPPSLFDTLDMVHGIREAQKRGGGQSDRPLWP